MTSIMDTLDEIKRRKMVEIVTNARRNRLAVKIRDIESKGAAEYVDLSLKTWDVLSGLIDIAGKVAAIGSATASATATVEAVEAIEYAKQASFLASGSSNIMETMTISEIMELAGPFVAWIAMWVNLGSPYLEAKAEIQKAASKRGIAHGILIACQRRTGHSARMFAMRQPGAVNNNWINDATSVAQNSYRMGFLAGYAQGKELTEPQKHIFWKIVGRSLKERNVGLWNPAWGETGNDNWIWEAGGIFQAKHISE